VFARGMVSDGKSEVYAYTSTDRSAAVGVLAKGSLWKRRQDMTGIGFNAGGISKSHTQYLEMGGIDGFIGDGKLNPGSERVFDVFYSANFLKSFWLAGDYQHITNPAFNRDRGPVNVWSMKVHGEF
jgi:high affinity Mn2+ porin